MSKKGSKKRKPIMCRSYFGFGIFSLIAGTLFLAVAVLTTFTFVRVFVVGFFIVLGIIDLALYSIFRER